MTVVKHLLLALIVSACIASAAVMARDAFAGPVSRTPARMLPPVGEFPDAPCTLANRMNIFIAEDGTMFECVCEALTQGHVCSWYHVADGPGADLRRRLKVRLHVRVLPYMVVLRV